MAIQEVVHTTEILSPFLKAALLHILDYEETFYIAMHDALEEKGSPEIFRKQLKHLLGRGIVVTKSNQNLELGWNPKKCSQNLKISGSVVEHTKGGSVYYSVLGNRCFSEGLHVWDIKMLATGHDYSFDAFVGVADTSAY